MVNPYSPWGLACRIFLVLAALFLLISCAQDTDPLPWPDTGPLPDQQIPDQDALPPDSLGDKCKQYAYLIGGGWTCKYTHTTTPPPWEETVHRLDEYKGKCIAGATKFSGSIEATTQASFTALLGETGFKIYCARH